MVALQVGEVNSGWSRAEGPRDRLLMFSPLAGLPNAIPTRIGSKSEQKASIGGDICQKGINPNVLGVRRRTVSRPYSNALPNQREVFSKVSQ